MFNLTSRWRHPLPWLLLLIGYSLWQQADGWLGLFDGQSWRQMGNFLATSWPPRVDRDFLAQARRPARVRISGREKPATK